MPDDSKQVRERRWKGSFSIDGLAGFAAALLVLLI